MAQLRVRGLLHGHDGAARGLGLPINTALKTADKTVLGACLLAKTTCLRMHQPTDHRLRNSPLRNFRWFEQGKVEQAVSHGGRSGQHGAAKQRQARKSDLDTSDDDFKKHYTILISTPVLIKSSNPDVMLVARKYSPTTPSSDTLVTSLTVQTAGPVAP